MKEWFIANLGSIGKCPVFFDLLWSICVFIVPQTYREEFRVTSKYLPENYAEHIEFVIIF